jgi:hypothetical protein
MVMDVGSIVPGDGDAGKQAIEQTRPLCGAKRLHIDCPAVFEIGEEQFGGCNECCSDIRCRNNGRGRRRGAVAAAEKNMEFMEDIHESPDGMNRGALS